MKKYAFVLLWAQFLAGCAVSPSVALNTGAENVEVLDYLPRKRKAELQELETVSCDVKDSSEEAEMEGCKNHLRNEAFKRGGSLVVVKPVKRKTLENYEVPTAVEPCPNCGTMKGLVFGIRGKRK